MKHTVLSGAALAAALLLATGATHAGRRARETRDADGRVVRILGPDGRARDIAQEAPTAPEPEFSAGGIDLPSDARDDDSTAAAEDTAWPMFQANARHTGYVPVMINPSSLSFRWQKNVGGTFALNPVTAAGGRVFVSLVTYFNNVPSLFALSAATGQTAWAKNFGSVFSVNPPSYGWGNVYVQTGNHGTDTWLHAFDAATGAVVFETPHQAQWERYFAPTLYRRRVYVNGGYYGGMYAFNAGTGAMLWFAALPQYDQWTPAVEGDRAYAYVGSYQPGLYGRDRMTGAASGFVPDPNFEWNGWSMNLAPVLGDHADVISIHDGRLISFDTFGGTIRWEVASQFTGQPSVTGDRIYAVDNGHLVVLDELNHAPLWSWTPPAGSLVGPMIVTDTHIFASTAQAVHAVDLVSHGSVWSYPVGGHLALSEGMLYVASTDGKLTAFAATGTRSRSGEEITAP